MLTILTNYVCIYVCVYKILNIYNPCQFIKFNYLKHTFIILLNNLHLSSKLRECQIIH